MTLIAEITKTGVIIPAFEEVLSELKERFRAIYGQDVNLDNDTADGQWVALIASAINDANAAIASAYAGYSPSTAQGEILSSVVKTNGIKRYISSKSTVDLRCVGQAGTNISSGIVEDDNGYRWQLPSAVVMPPEGEIIVTATCQTAGSINALPGSVTKIMTPTMGWQMASNPASASAGNPVETDAELRRRQTLSVALPSRSVFEGVLAGIADINGVTAFTGIDNDTNEPDENGIPGHTIAMIVDGGDVKEIADAVFIKKSPGTGTYGKITEKVKDSYGIAHAVKFSRSEKIIVKGRITLIALSGYETDVGEYIKQSVADYINGLSIGESISYTRLYLPASLYGAGISQSYKLISIEISKLDETPTETDIQIAFNEKVEVSPENIQIVVQS